MEKNLGSADRFLRLIAGSVFLINIPIRGPEPAGIIAMAVIGAAFLASSVSGCCLLYLPLKIDTRWRPQKR